MRRLAINVLGGILAVALLAVVPALAQEEPPARVGRVSFVSGQLGFHLAGETAWSAAKVNYPVATGGSFWTDPKSRAELRVGSRTIDGISGQTRKFRTIGDGARVGTPGVEHIFGKLGG